MMGFLRRGDFSTAELALQGAGVWIRLLYDTPLLLLQSVMFY